MSEQPLSVYDLTQGRIVAKRFEVVRPHRQGGLSTAFEVRDRETDDRCEMQLFPSGLFEAEGQAQEFSASWSPWKRVRSPSVLRVREIVPLGGSSLILITDFPEGDALRARLNARKRLPVGDVVRLGVQVLEGLEEIHAHGLVHGDIKPYTIHVRGDGAGLRPTLVDGGITPGLWSAKHLGEKTALIGTPYYAPVEQFGGDSPTVQSDVYNVAAVLFESIAGTLPWRGVSFLEVFQAKLDKRPPSLRRTAPDLKVDEGLEEAIATGCLAERSGRYATAREFRDRLAEFLPE